MKGLRWKIRIGCNKGSKLSNHLVLALMCLLGIVLIMATACNDTSSSTSSSTPFFPVQKELGRMYPTALAGGKLVLDNCCLRLKDSAYDYSCLPIWPYGYSLSIEGKEIQVIDNNGKPIARVGDTITVGGGEISAEIAAKYSVQPLPDSCSGPFWLVSKVVENQ